jgi:uncharacterized protein (TIGR00288 family)
MEKSIVLIDAQNVLKAWQKYCVSNQLTDCKIDYKKLVGKLSEGTNLLRAYFYDGVEENIPLKKKNFLTAIQSEGIQLKTKILKNRTSECYKCGNVSVKLVQKGVDVSLATDILRHSLQQTCEICIVVSGDEDYKDAVDLAKDKGVKVWISSFKSSLSRELRNSADKVILLEDIFEEIKR